MNKTINQATWLFLPALHNAMPFQITVQMRRGIIQTNIDGPYVNAIIIRSKGIYKVSQLDFLV